jgi:hypothetical protein
MPTARRSGCRAQAGETCAPDPTNDEIAPFTGVPGPSPGLRIVVPIERNDGRGALVRPERGFVLFIRNRNKVLTQYVSR